MSTRIKGKKTHKLNPNVCKLTFMLGQTLVITYIAKPLNCHSPQCYHCLFYISIVQLIKAYSYSVQSWREGGNED